MDNKTTLPAVGPIWKTAWGIYKKNFWKYALIVLAPAALTIALFFAVFPALANISRGGSIAVLLISALLLIVAFLWGYAALLSSIRSHYHSEGTGFGFAYKIGWKKILPLLAIILLNILFTLGGYILLIIPGIILSTWFYFVAMIVIDTDKQGIDVFRHSKNLVRGWWGWWGVTGLVAVVAIISTILTLLIQLILSAITNTEIGSLVTQIIQALIITPFVMVYFWVFYERLKETRGDAEAPKSQGMFILFGIFGGIAVIIIALVAILVPILISRVFQSPYPGMFSDEAEMRAWIESMQEAGELPTDMNIDDYLQDEKANKN